MYARRQTLYESLLEFYADEDNLRRLSEVLGKNPPVSLRTIDWLTTNHSKANNLYVDGQVTPINIYIAYKAALKSVGKRLLDPFSRRERLLFKNIEGKEFYTTLGQLNFFRWAIKNKVLDYAIQNASQIEQHMLKASAKEPQQPQQKRRQKRKELSRAANKSCTRTLIKCRVKLK